MGGVTENRISLTLNTGCQGCVKVVGLSNYLECPSRAQGVAPMVQKESANCKKRAKVVSRVLRHPTTIEETECD